MYFIKKEVIRKHFLKIRSSYLVGSFYKKNTLLCKNLSLLLDMLSQRVLSSKVINEHKGLTLGLYLPLCGEPDLIKIMLDNKWKIVIPKVFENDQLKMVLYESLNDALVKGRYGLEPVKNLFIVPDLVVVPGISFSLEGYRIGFGKGSYDKYLAYNAQDKNIICIGVCFHEFLIERFNFDLWDFKFQFIVTDKIILKL